MSGYVWDLSGTDRQCDLYRPGHQIHWIHFNHSMREPSVVIPVTAVVDYCTGSCTSKAMTYLWCGGIIARRYCVRRWIASTGGRTGNHAGTSSPSRRKPSWAVREVCSTGGAVQRRRECRALHSTNPDHLIPSKPSPTNRPPLRIAARYADGRPTSRNG